MVNPGVELRREFVAQNCSLDEDRPLVVQNVLEPPWSFRVVADRALVEHRGLNGRFILCLRSWGRLLEVLFY